MLFLAETAIASESAEEALKVCREIEEDPNRLKCFDQVVTQFFFPAYSGDGNKRTALFLITDPVRVRYRSEHVIFVLYVKNAEGEMIMNGHQGAPGEAYLDLTEPGQYYFEINASGPWKIWLESQEG